MARQVLAARAASSSRPPWGPSMRRRTPPLAHGSVGKPRSTHGGAAGAWFGACGELPLLPFGQPPPCSIPPPAGRSHQDLSDERALACPTMGWSTGGRNLRLGLRSVGEDGSGTGRPLEPPGRTVPPIRPFHALRRLAYGTRGAGDPNPPVCRRQDGGDVAEPERAAGFHRAGSRADVPGRASFCSFSTFLPRPRSDSHHSPGWLTMPNRAVSSLRGHEGWPSGFRRSWLS